MELKDLQRFEGLAGRTGEPPEHEREALWDAVATLVRHLDDHLVIADEILIPDGTVCALTVFHARDAAHTPLYALVTTEGIVTIGRTDDLGRNQAYPLSGRIPARSFTMAESVLRLTPRASAACVTLTPNGSKQRDLMISPG